MAFSEFEGATGLILLEDGTVIPGSGNGAEGHIVGEFCFNTAMTGYQEILTDPSYASQIITFTMPHIGNVGVNMTDCESAIVRAGGCITACSLTEASNYRAELNLACWLKKHGLVCVSEIDSRALTRHIRRAGAPGGLVAHSANGRFDMKLLEKELAAWEGMEKRDLASEVSCREIYEWSEGLYDLKQGGHQQNPPTRHHIIAFDYGLKENMLRHLAMRGARITVVPLDEKPETVFALKPDGFFLTNGPGDPSATNKKTREILRQIIDYGKPVFGICLGHQLLALAFGAQTKKMYFGHHGANHPVKNLEKGWVEITSQNHGFTVEGETLPAVFEVTHKSLFDDTVEGLRLKGRPVFSVQYHPEASPGPHDSHYLFDDFIRLVDDMKASP